MIDRFQVIGTALTDLETDIREGLKIVEEQIVSLAESVNSLSDRMHDGFVDVNQPITETVDSSLMTDETMIRDSHE